MPQDQKNQDGDSKLPTVSEICGHFNITPEDLVRIIRTQMLVNKRFYKQYVQDTEEELVFLRRRAEMLQLKFQIEYLILKIENENSSDRQH